MFEMPRPKVCCMRDRKKILRDLCIEDVGFFNIEEGKETLLRNLRSVKVFIVLDDVDHMDQLVALMPSKDRLESGSRIIVTTREYDVLKFWPVATTYKMRALDPVYAKQLFSWHAFGQPFHQDGFEELVEKFLEACNRLPLSLKVIARQLKGEFDKEIWESLLHKVMTVVPNDIQEILKISYYNLDHQEKEMFLDVACFFIGEESSLVIEIWNGLGWSGQQGLKSLLNKCLVEIDGVKINMHDHIRDLGRSIATSQSPYRFGLSKTIINVQNQIEKTIGIHGIIETGDQVDWIDWGRMMRYPKMAIGINDKVDDFHIRCSDREIRVETNRGIWPLSPSSVGLKYLVITGDSFSEVLGEVSRDLVWLRWFDYRQSNILPGISMQKLRVLEIFGDLRHRSEKDGEDFSDIAKDSWYIEEDFEEDFSAIEEAFSHHEDYEEEQGNRQLEKLWVDSEAPLQLRHLLLSECNKFQGFPKSIGLLNHLKRIVITPASRVRNLPDEFCFLKSLEHLTLISSKLQSLPINFGNLSNLRHLDLWASIMLRRLPASFKNLSLLQHLNLEFCRELTLKLDCLQNVTKLEYLNLDGCEQFELPRHIANNVSLTELRLRCPLRKLPENIGQLSKLRRMFIEDALLRTLPTSLRWLSSLRNLDIRNCPELKCLPDSLGDLSSLTKLDISDCPKLDRMGEKSVAKAMRQLSNLQSLSVVKCPISGSSLSFGSSSLKYIELEETEVWRISCSAHLETLEVQANRYLVEIKALPMTLESIYLKDSEMLEKIGSLARSTSLREFRLEGRNRIVKIEGIENCIGLEDLNVESRMEVPGIESLEHLRNLRELKLSANKGAVIERCIQRIQEWPSETTMICARAVPDAASLLQSLLPPNVEIVDSISNQKIQSSPQLTNTCIERTNVEKGRWAWVGVYTQRSSYSSKEEWRICSDEEESGEESGEEDEVERGVAVMGEEGTLMEAFRRLWPLFIQS